MPKTQKQKEANRRWYWNNREKIREKEKIYRIKNHDRILERQRKAYSQKKEIYNHNRRKKYEKNKEKILKRNALWAKRNKHKRREVDKRKHNRNKNNPDYVLRRRLRTRVYYVLRKPKFQKAKDTMKLIGCSLDNLKNHLENKFTDGMTWGNIGEWHIDHIIPCASFDLTKESEQKRCFNYRNLQPLWRQDNLRKSWL